jgi:hypothetical protein
MLSCIYPFLDFKEDVEEQEPNYLETMVKDFYDDITKFFEFLQTTDLLEMCILSFMLYEADS